MKPPVVTITNFCLNHAGYFDWLVTGLGLLAERGELDLRFRLPAAKAALRHRYFRWGAKAIAPSWVAKVNDKMWWLEGQVDFGGKIVRFVYDVTDHGQSYAEHLLEGCDLYFKCQLPFSFPGPLEINRTIERPMPSAAVANAAKIRPAMLGRPLSRALDFKKNLALLKDWESHASTPKTKRLFAYFGGDSDAEADLFKDKQGLYQHPNLKRGRLVRFLRGLNDPRVDARLVNSSDPSLTGPALKDDAAYASAVSSAAYNLNVSGLSLSLPFRLIDSFMVGTAVVTDSLAIDWYAPFDREREVIELGPMGYELESEVDWGRAETRLLELIESSPECDEEHRAFLLDRYQRLWSPAALARHVLGECRGTL